MKTKQKYCCCLFCGRKSVIIKMCTILAPKCPHFFHLIYSLAFVASSRLVIIPHLLASHEKHDKIFHFSELNCIKTLMSTGHDKDNNNHCLNNNICFMCYSVEVSSSLITWQRFCSSYFLSLSFT